MTKEEFIVQIALLGYALQCSPKHITAVTYMQPNNSKVVFPSPTSPNGEEGIVISYYPRGHDYNCGGRFTTYDRAMKRILGEQND